MIDVISFLKCTCYTLYLVMNTENVFLNMPHIVSLTNI